MREAAVLHALGRFLVEVRGFFGIIRIDGNNYAATGHQRRVGRDGVVGFDFVGPPVGKRGSTNASRRELIGDFVPFEDVLKGANFEAEFLGHSEKHEDFVFAVAMRVHVALAFEYFDKGLEFQIAARRNEIFFARGNALVVIVPSLLVIAGLAERGTNGFFDAHASGGITPRLAGNAEVGALGVLTEGELDAGHSAFKRKL